MYNLPLFFELNLDFSTLNYIPISLTIFLIFSVRRLLKLIFSESMDIEILDHEIRFKNIITRKTISISKKRIKGYRVERFEYNFFTISGIKSFYIFSSNMLVVYSNFKAIVHLKSFNYGGLDKINTAFQSREYKQLYRNKRLFDYKKI